MSATTRARPASHPTRATDDRADSAASDTRVVVSVTSRRTRGNIMPPSLPFVSPEKHYTHGMEPEICDCCGQEIPPETAEGNAVWLADALVRSVIMANLIRQGGNRAA
jgi:hypothetical protein